MKPNGIDVLIAEDDSSDREIISRVIKKLKPDITMQFVEDGIEAVNFLFGKEQYSHRTISETPKLVIIDLKMPIMGGFEVLEKIKADEDMCVVPVVILTSSSQSSDLKKAYQMKANSYVVKPIKFEDFSHAVEKIVSYWLFTNEIIHH